MSLDIAQRDISPRREEHKRAELLKRLMKVQSFMDKLLLGNLTGLGEEEFMRRLEDGHVLRQIAMKLDRLGACEISPPTPLAKCPQTYNNVIT